MTLFISLSMAFRTASMPRHSNTSTMSFVTVRTGSTPLSDRTRRSAVPSVSRIHSLTARNSPSGVISILFLSSVLGSTMYTFEMAGIPCRVMSVNMFDSMQRRKTSSSILSTCSSCSSPTLFSLLFMIRMRRTNFCELSSLKMQLRSSPKPDVIFSEICSMDNFLSTIRL